MKIGCMPPVSGKAGRLCIRMRTEFDALASTTLTAGFTLPSERQWGTSCANFRTSGLDHLGGVAARGVCMGGGHYARRISHYLLGRRRAATRTGSERTLVWRRVV